MATTEMNCLASGGGIDNVEAIYLMWPTSTGFTISGLPSSAKKFCFQKDDDATLFVTNDNNGAISTTDFYFIQNGTVVGTETGKLSITSDGFVVSAAFTNKNTYWGGYVTY